jgi:hypothetical protein
MLHKFDITYRDRLYDWVRICSCLTAKKLRRVAKSSETTKEEKEHRNYMK